MMLAVRIFNDGGTVYNVLDEGELPSVELDTYEQPVEFQAETRSLQVSGYTRLMEIEIETMRR